MTDPGRWRSSDVQRAPHTGTLGAYLNAGFHSRRGEQAQAANWTRQALESLPWDDDMIVSEGGGWQVHLDDSLDWMMAFVQQAPGAIAAAQSCDARVIVSRETWKTLADYDPTVITYFMDEMKAGGAVTGMRFIVKDAPPIAGAIRAQAAAQGTGVTAGKDALTELEERANTLIVQAASLNRSPTDTQRQVFAVRYAELQRDYKALTARLDDLAGVLQLAGTAVFDVSS